MKKFILLFWALLGISFAHAQDTPAEFANQTNFIFQHLNRTEATTGILTDYGIEFQNLDNFNGTVLLDSNYVTLSSWRALYASLLTSQYNNLISFKSPTALNTKLIVLWQMAYP